MSKVLNMKCNHEIPYQDTTLPEDEVITRCLKCRKYLKYYTYKHTVIEL